MPISALISHLVKVGGFSVSSANYAIKMFNLHIQRTFWNIATDSIKKHHANGVRLRILGHGIHTMFPVLAFGVGDEPAQHVFCSVKQGNTHRPCIQCTFAPAMNLQYTRHRFPDRNFEDIKEKCALAEELLQVEQENNTQRCYDFIEERSKGGRRGKNAAQPKLLKIKRSERDPVFDFLERNSIEPFVNALHDMPMGENNHMYKTPNDLFHVMCAGLMKSAALWTLTIINGIMKHDATNYSDAGAIFDSNLHHFPLSATLEGVPNTRFRKGLMYIAQNKDKGEQQQATGSGGGYR
jgi:hypothetical protein